LNLLLLVPRKHHQRLAVTELALLQGHSGLWFADVIEVLPCQLEGSDFLRRHHVEMDLAFAACNPGIEHVHGIE